MTSLGRKGGSFTALEGVQEEEYFSSVIPSAIVIKKKIQCTLEATIMEISQH